MRCGEPVYDNGIRAAVVHHTAGSNDYAPEDSAGDRPVDLRVPHPHAGLVRHRLQRAGRQVRPGLRGPRRRHHQGRRGLAHRRLQPRHLGRGDDRRLRDRAADRRSRSRTIGRLLGWRLGLDHVEPAGHSGIDARPVATSPTSRPARRRRCRRSSPTATSATPNARATRLRGDGPDPRHRRALQRPARPETSPTRCAAVRSSPSGSRWAARPARSGAPTSPEAAGEGAAAVRHLRPAARSTGHRESGAEPLTGAIYEAWASLGFERGALGLPTSGEIQEPAVDRAELPARHAELRPRERHRDPRDRRRAAGMPPPPATARRCS